MTAETESNSEPGAPALPVGARKNNAILLALMALFTAVMCGVVARGVPLWGSVAWGTDKTLNWSGNWPFLGLLIALGALHAWWTRGPVAPADSAAQSVGKVALLCFFAFAIALSARSGENAGLARIAILTVNPASGGFFEAAYDSRQDPNWLQNYTDLMKRYHHVHSHPPMGVGLMRWWLEKRSPALTSAADDFLAFSPGTNCAALAGFASRIWKRPYTADDMGAAFWGGLMWIAMAALVPAAIFVATREIFGARAALHGAVLSCATPSFVLFLPGADLSYVFFAALSLALAVAGAKRVEKWGGKALLGAGAAVAAVGAVGSFALAWTMVLVTLFLLARGGPNHRISAAIFAGASALSLLVLQGLGINWWLLWRSLIAFNVDAHVPPVLRFTYHLTDFFAFFGVAASVLLFAGLRKFARRASAPIAGEETFPNRDFLALTIPTLGVLLLLNVVISMAETARIWMLFMPPLLVAVAGFVARRDASGHSLRLSNALIALHLAQTWIFSLFLDVYPI